MVGVMERLRASDLEAALGFLREASAETGPDPFPVHIVERLRVLVGCQWGTFCELDRRRHVVRAIFESPVPDDIADEDDTFWRIVDEHPLCREQRRGRFDALKLSDFHSRRELHRLEVYNDWFRPGGVEYELEVAIPSPFEHTKTFLFDDAHRDFTERDRALLNLLRPHFAQLYRAALVRRIAASARAVLEDGRDLGERGLLLADAHGAIDAASPLARRLLDDYFADASGTHLPPALARWLEGQRAGAQLTVDGPSGTLVVGLDRRGDADVLVLEEHAAADPAALSAREREVLALVGEGLRNADIAEALWVSPATVRKHLENIYEKLDVHTRTAAVAAVSSSSPARSRS
jgi:DNA-binding CsgD family transcriptional regulator